MVGFMPFQEMLAAFQKTKEFFLTQLKQSPQTSQNIQKAPINEEKQYPDNEGYLHLFETQYTASLFKKSVHIYSHLDSDGISAATILARTLERAQIGFQITILNQLETQYIDEIISEIQLYNRFIIFADFGSGQTHLLEKYLKPDDYLILDHHTPVNTAPPLRDNHVNPYFFGIDGSFQISGAGVCYLFAKTMDPKNIDLSYIAIIGALGDAQNQNSDKGEFQSPNREILNDAIQIGKLEVITDIAISRSRPLTQAVAYTLPIPVTGLSNNESLVKAFLEANNIHTVNDLNEPRFLIDLTPLEKKSLSKALIQYALIQNKMDPSFAAKMVTNYYLIKEQESRSSVADAREMSSLLNACGRSGHPSLGIAILLKQPGAIEEAIKETKEHRKNIALAMQWAEEHLVHKENLISVYGGDVIDEKIIGTIASMLLHSGKKISKPIIAYAEADKDSFKVSARSPPFLIDAGLDLGVIMRKVSAQLGIENPAGGHPPAAGAKIPQTKLGEFLTLVDTAIKEMLEKKKDEK